nr:unnamed protein product [Callosobruchus chinensis]
MENYFSSVPKREEKNCRFKNFCFWNYRHIRV